MIDEIPASTQITFPVSIAPGMTSMCQNRSSVVCGGCRHVTYCSEACQKADWNTHKLVCFKLDADNAGSCQVHGRSIYLDDPCQGSGWRSAPRSVVAHRLSPPSSNSINGGVCCAGEHSTQLVQAELTTKLAPIVSNPEHTAHISRALATVLIAGNGEKRGAEEAGLSASPSKAQATDPASVESSAQFTLLDSLSEKIRSLSSVLPPGEMHGVVVRFYYSIATVLAPVEISALLSKQPMHLSIWESELEAWMSVVFSIFTGPSSIKGAIMNAIFSGLWNRPAPMQTDGDDENAAKIKQQQERLSLEMLFYGRYTLWKSLTGNNEIPRLLPVARHAPPNSTIFIMGRPSSGERIAASSIEEFSPVLRKLNVSNNGLESLPPLPPNLVRLIANQNQLKALPPLPASLRILEVISNKLEALPPLPVSLKFLIVSDNKIKEIPPLPASLIYLDASENELKGVPMLSGTQVYHLDVSMNQIDRFDTLFPRSLKYLYASDNILYRLPLLPPALEILFVDDNRLTHIGILPDSLEELDASGNRLTRLPDLPKSLRVLNVEDNELSVLPDLPESLEELSIDRALQAYIPRLSSLRILRVDGEEVALPVPDAAPAAFPLGS